MLGTHAQRRELAIAEFLVMADVPRYRFPGMDPWLETPGIWASVHDALIVGLAHDLNAQIRPSYVAVPGARLVVEESLVAHRCIYPDVAVIESRGAPARAAAVSTLEDPLVIHLDSEPRRETFLEIRDPRAGNLLVTIVEVLSPANKEPGHDGRRQYLTKQEQVVAGDVNLVELDLLRGGEFTVAVPRGLCPRSPYRIVLRRSGARDRAEVYAVQLHQRLPRIRIPLRAGEPDAHAGLQALIERVYRDGSYDLLVDYRTAPEPPLSAEDARWAQLLLAD